ncbi:hypothetical protein [Paraburkholderia phytofirmans]|nr:hypothetical protein [Paraburkholderia phytofirmans]
MSTTIPLTLIEGSMALPSLSPLCRVLPPPFGRDWALLPPAHSLRAELKALYAAVLRTFCLNAEAIRALCQWESRRLPPVASSSLTSPAASTTVFDAPVDESLLTSAEATPVSPVSAPAVPVSPRGGSMHWGALAGGACALGGAAMLAWIAFGHLAQRHTIGDVKPAVKAPVREEAQSANRRPANRRPANRHSPDAAVTPYSAANSRPAAHAPGTVSSPLHVPDASGSVPASPENLQTAFTAAPLRDFTASATTEITAPVTATAARAIAGKNVSRRQEKQRKGAANQHERSGRGSQATIATQLSSRLSSQLPPQLPPQLSPQLPLISQMNSEVPQIAVSENAQRTSPKPSSAGPYSPLAPSQLGTDEYASTTLSAGTHLRSIAPASRPASSINPSETGGTEWINHMSQRRVTEVPDQFAK